MADRPPETAVACGSEMLVGEGFDKDASDWVSRRLLVAIGRAPLRVRLDLIGWLMPAEKEAPQARILSVDAGVDA